MNRIGKASRFVFWLAYPEPFCWAYFVTALYTFRMFFLVFHGEERMDAETKSHLHETPWVVTVPLILLAIPSAIIGWYTVEPMLFGGYFGDAIEVTQRHDVLARLGHEWHGSYSLVTHAIQTPIFWLAAAGVFTAWFLYLKRPDIPETIKARCRVSTTCSIASTTWMTLHQGVCSGRTERSVEFLWQEGRRADNRRCPCQWHGEIRSANWRASCGRFRLAISTLTHSQ